MIRLTVRIAGQPAREHCFDTRTTIGIGRAPGNAVQIADGRVSSLHGEVLPHGDGWVFRDLRSTNGSLRLRDDDTQVVDGRSGRPIGLRDGDALLLGDIDDPVILEVAIAAVGAEAPLDTEGTVVARRAMDRAGELSRVLTTNDRSGGVLALLRQVGGAVDPDAVFDRIAAFLLQELSAAKAVALVVAGRDERSRLLTRGGEAADVAGTDGEDDPPPWPRALVERVHEGGDAVAVVLSEGPAEEASLVRLGVQGAMAAPLTHDGRCFGALLVTGPGAFGRGELDLLAALALQVASTLAGARLIRRLQAVERRLREENRYLRTQAARDHTFTDIIGDSPPMRQVFEQMRLVKDTDATVLITGETGTGKELVARALHDKSRRAAHTFAAVNCAALSENLLESELFGHVKGAFTGATDHKKGLFQAADKGTLFLDELGEMSMALQAKLLRALQEGEILPVGATRPVAVDVRVVAATHRDLRSMAHNGTFREDLYYRVNVFPIHLPPLRERGDDVLALAEVFLQRYAARFGKQVPGLTDAAAARLKAHGFPGNIRELENEVQRAVLLTPDGALVDAVAFSEGLRHGGSVLDAAPGGGGLKETMEALEREVLRRALEERGWNRAQTARDLGISRQALMVKLARYELVPE